MSEYAWMYKTKMWRKLREAHISKQPLCQSCMRHGRVKAANVVHHVDAHRGRWHLFVEPNNLESVCDHCHNSEMQHEEKNGYNDTIGNNGWPIDPRHPHNKI